MTLWRNRKVVPPMLLWRTVARSELVCSWCKYPIKVCCAVYALTVGGSALGPVFCTARCGKNEARERGRGPVEPR